MKTQIVLGLAAAVLAACAQAQNKQGAAPAATVQVQPDRPPVFQAPSQTPPQRQNPPEVFVYKQQLVQQPVAIYSREQAQAIVDGFRSNYDKLGSPRMLIYVNRELVDEQSGMKISARSEQVDTTRSVTESSTNNSTNLTTRTTAKNTYSNNGKAAPTLADRQTVRDVERLIGRPLRAAGAPIADQRNASQLIGDRPLDSITAENEQARKDREAVGKVADVVIEVLMSSRTVTVAELNGDKTYSVPDIQATAIRLKDSKIVGQASASELMNRVGGPAAAARNFSVQDITEATSLALMADMLQEAK